jgi:hypothetical protein
MTEGDLCAIAALAFHSSANGFIPYPARRPKP